MTAPLTLASFFSGVGGIDLGFENTGAVTTLYANEFDPYPAETMSKNFDIEIDTRSIVNITGKDVPPTDIIAGGFPCQAFSVAGYRQGFNDEKGRGNLFFDLMRIVSHHKPQVVFLENVKNLETHDKGNTLAVILDALTQEGYTYSYQVLNAKDYGNIPQNRERIYIVAFRDPTAAEKFHFPAAIPLTTTLRDVIDFNNKVDDKYYYVEGKYKGNIYNMLIDAMDDDDAVYQWRRKYVRKNKNKVVPTLTANMGGGGHNVPLVKTTHGIRKLTPVECFNVQGFPPEFILPNQADSRLYKQAGNSVCVPVIERIARNIIGALEQ